MCIFICVQVTLKFKFWAKFYRFFFYFYGEQRGDHDWYCFECHTAGEVLPCSDCWRVFHPSCTLEEWTGPKFTCSICQVRMPKYQFISLIFSYMCINSVDTHFSKFLSLVKSQIFVLLCLYFHMF